MHPGSTQSGASLPETFPQGSGPCYLFILLILQPELLVQGYCPQAQVILSLGNLTLTFQVFGPKPPADGTSGDRLWDSGAGHVLLPVRPELCTFGTSFYALTWTSSLSVYALCAHLARCSFCCSELQGSHLTRVTVELPQLHMSSMKSSSKGSGGHGVDTGWFCTQCLKPCPEKSVQDGNSPGTDEEPMKE